MKIEIVDLVSFRWKFFYSGNELNKDHDYWILNLITPIVHKMIELTLKNLQQMLQDL